MVCRILSQNLLCTIRYRILRWDEQVYVTNFVGVAVEKDLVWYATGINNFIDGYQKCLARYGDYIEIT